MTNLNKEEIKKQLDKMSLDGIRIDELDNFNALCRKEFEMKAEEALLSFGKNGKNTIDLTPIKRKIKIKF